MLSHADKKNRYFLLIICVLLLVVSYLWNPTELNIVTCHFLKITGHSCPTCGMSRSLHAASHFNFRDSFSFHLMGPFLFLTLIFLLVFFSVELLMNKKVLANIKPAFRKNIFIGIAGTWFFYYLVRLYREF